MYSRSHRGLIRDGKQCLDAVAAGDLKIVFELFGLEVVAAGLDLDKAGPHSASTTDPDESIRYDLLPIEVKLDLDEAFDLSGMGPQCPGE
jgi:hypothetical protein